MSWIPRKKYFQMIAAGLIERKPKTTKTKKKSARHKTRRIKTRRASKVSKSKVFKTKGIPKLRTFTIFVKGEEKETVTGRSQRKAEIDAQKKYHTKRILITESYEN